MRENGTLAERVARASCRMQARELSVRRTSASGEIGQKGSRRSFGIAVLPSLVGTGSRHRLPPARGHDLVCARGRHAHGPKPPPASAGSCAGSVSGTRIEHGVAQPDAPSDASQNDFCDKISNVRFRSKLLGCHYSGRGDTLSRRSCATSLPRRGPSERLEATRRWGHHIALVTGWGRSKERICPADSRTGRSNFVNRRS